jgi:hypothetical protein
MTLLIRKFGATALAITAAIALTGSSAFAFECYNASRSDNGNAAAAKAQALVSAEEALMLFCGLDADQAADVIATLEDEGFDTDFLINGHTIMAGGLERNGKGEDKLDDGQAIDHLSEEFFAALAVLAPSCDE